MPVPWQYLIVEMAKAKEALHERDVEGILEYHLPRMAATEHQLQANEGSLGERLDAKLRDYFGHAGGWRWFWHRVHLLGPEELAGGPAMDYAQDMLRMSDFSEAGCAPEDLLPIASGPNDTDVFAIGRKGTSVEGRVLWFAGGLVDVFDDFEHYFASMSLYNRRHPDAYFSDSKR